MKKLLLLFIILLTGISGVWATETVTIKIGPDYGTYHKGWNQAALGTGDWGAYWRSSRKHIDGSDLLRFNGETGMNTSNGDIYGNQTYTLKAADGCTIKSYSFNGTARGGDMTITPYGGSGTVITSGNKLSSNLTVDVNDNSTTFVLSPQNTHFENLDLTVTIEVNAAIAQFDATPKYRIYTKYDGTSEGATKYYLKANGTLTDVKEDAGSFSFIATTSNYFASAGYAFKITTGDGSYFTNPNKTERNAKIRTTSTQSREDWEGQVFIFDGSKFAIRSTNATGSGEWEQDAFWTVNTDGTNVEGDETDGVPEVDYTVSPHSAQYVWGVETDYYGDKIGKEFSSSLFDDEATVGNDYFMLKEGSDKSMLRGFYGMRYDVLLESDYNLIRTAIVGSINYPVSGCYRIKSSGERNIGYSYICYGSSMYGTGLRTVAVDNAGSDISSIIRLTGSKGVYKLSTQGLNVQSQTASNTAFTVTDADGVDFHFNISSPGVVTICNEDSESGDRKGCLHEGQDGTPYKGVINWNPGSIQSRWTVEDASTVNIPLTYVSSVRASFSTLYLPFGATITGAKAYILTVSGEWAIPSEITEIPANTGVLLRADGEVASATVTINDAASEETTGNMLTGTNVDITADRSAGEYILGNGEDGLGFYQRKSGRKIGANKAYLQLDADLAAGVKGLLLNFDIATGIDGLTPDPSLSKKGEEIFNLAGQRMSRVQKGVNIVNGKKVLVK